MDISAQSTGCDVFIGGKRGQRITTGSVNKVKRKVWVAFNAKSSGDLFDCDTGVITDLLSEPGDGIEDGARV